jgi:hypothetical protein
MKFFIVAAFKDAKIIIATNYDDAHFRESARVRPGWLYFEGKSARHSADYSAVREANQ